MAPFLRRAGGESCGVSRGIEEVNPTLAKDAPRFFRYSFIALMVSFLETELDKICHHVGRKRELSVDQVSQELSGNGRVKRAKRFLKNQLKDQFQDPGI